MVDDAFVIVVIRVVVGVVVVVIVIALTAVLGVGLLVWQYLKAKVQAEDDCQVGELVLEYDADDGVDEGAGLISAASPSRQIEWDAFTAPTDDGMYDVMHGGIDDGI